MPEKGRKVALWLAPGGDAFSQKAKRALKDDFKLVIMTERDQALDRFNFDNPEVDIVIIELESVIEDVAVWSDVLSTFRSTDPDIPIIVITDIVSQPREFLYAAGQSDAVIESRTELLANEEHLYKFINRATKLLDKNPRYDQDQRRFANEVADDYIDIETQGPGTVAYWLFEEEIIRELTRAKEEERKGKFGLGSKEIPFQVLDVGAGTGRFAQVVLNSSEFASVMNVDFAGKMLAVAKARVENEGSLKGTNYNQRCKFIRALGERLPKNFKNYDLVILGFGFPSYSPTPDVLKEARRVINENSGWLFASVYNHSALSYDRWSELAADDKQRPISTWIDRDAGKIQIPVGKSGTTVPINARTYTVEQFAQELRQADFYIAGYLSFPVLYSTLIRSEIEALARIEKEAGRFEAEKTKYSKTPFSFSLWQVDQKLSWHLRDKGFYTIFLAAPSESVANSLKEALPRKLNKVHQSSGS